MMSAGAQTLAGRHQALEAAIGQELKRPLPDFVRIKRLKQQKLAIKDALAAMRGSQTA